MIHFSITFTPGLCQIILINYKYRNYAAKRKGDMEILVKKGHFFVINRVVTVLLFL